MFIYKIVNKLNGKIYVGQTARSLEIRYYEHLKDFRRNLRNGSLAHGSSKLYRAFAKYGVENFAIEEIETVLSLEELDRREQFWIQNLQSMDRGYNLTTGGLNRKVSDETRRLISRNNFVPVHCYDLSGEFIRSFESMLEASLNTKASQAHISGCIRGKRKSSGGFQWSSVKLEHLSPRFHDRRPPVIRKKTAKIDDNGNILEVYSSRIEAGLKNRCVPEDVTRVCSGSKPSVNGLKFKSID